MSKLSNVLSMLQLLQNGKKYSIKELSEKLEVTPRMIRVYKEELELAHEIMEKEAEETGEPEETEEPEGETSELAEKTRAELADLDDLDI